MTAYIAYMLLTQSCLVTRQILLILPPATSGNFYILFAFLNFVQYRKLRWVTEYHREDTTKLYLQLLSLDIRQTSLLCRQTVSKCKRNTEITQCSNIFTFDLFGRRKRWLAIVTGKQKMKMKGVTESQWRLIRKAHTSQYYWSLAAPSQIYFVTWTTWRYL